MASTQEQINTVSEYGVGIIATSVGVIATSEAFSGEAVVGEGLLATGLALAVAGIGMMVHATRRARRAELETQNSA